MYTNNIKAVCHYYMGPWGERAALLAADVIVIGALTVYYVLMSKFFFGAGMSIYQLSNSNSSEPVMPFVDDQQCVAKQLNRTGQLNSTFEVSEGVDLKASFSDAFHVNKSVPLYLLFVLALCCIKDSSFFNRFSAFGTLTVFLIFFGMFQTFYKLRWVFKLIF